VLKAGALIVSSGLGGVYPKGIPIGTIVSELKTPEGYARSYLLRPAVKLPDITSVMILTPGRVRAGLENVWELGTASDSATKGVVAAGDSLSGKARARSAAPRARPDTARPDSARPAP
jgi:rod shape-determining protein MreC